MKHLKMSILISPLVFLMIIGCAGSPKKRPDLFQKEVNKPILVKVLGINRLCFKQEVMIEILNYISELEANQKDE